MAQSGSNEVLVSRVVTDLVAGAGLKFSERGSHELKGLPGRWDLFAAIEHIEYCLLLALLRHADGHGERLLAGVERK
jgi:hypothetical protein